MTVDRSPVSVLEGWCRWVGRTRELPIYPKGKSWVSVPPDVRQPQTPEHLEAILRQDHDERSWVDEFMAAYDPNFADYLTAEQVIQGDLPLSVYLYQKLVMGITAKDWVNKDYPPADEMERRYAILLLELGQMEL